MSKPPQNCPWKHLLFITIQITLVSISNGTQMKEDIMAFVDNRGFPGGPLAWFDTNYPKTPFGIGNLFGVMSFWMQDGFLVSTLLSFQIFITTFPDVPLLHLLWIKFLLSHCSWYSILGICLCVSAPLPKSRHWIDSVGILSFFHFNRNRRFHIITVCLEFLNSDSHRHSLLCLHRCRKCSFDQFDCW